MATACGPDPTASVVVTVCARNAAGSSRIAKARGATRVANLRWLEWQGVAGKAVMTPPSRHRGVFPAGMVAVTCCAGIAAGSSRIAKARGATRIANLRLLEWQGGSGGSLHDASRTDMTMGSTTVGRKLVQVKYESQARTHEGD